MIKEFKEFMMRGNVIDLAVAVIIGAAFNEIVKGLVDGVIMPLIAAIGGVPDVTKMSFMLNGSSIQYGLFLQAVLNFLLIGVVLFFIVKSMNKTQELIKKKFESEQKVAEDEAKEDEAAKQSTTEDLLKEIRDLLAESKK